MASTLSSFTLILYIVVLSALNRPSSSDTAALVNQICSQARSYGICHRFFWNRVNSPTTDIITLNHIALDESLSLIESTHKLVQMLKAREHDKNIKNLYSICDSSYEILTDQLVSANSAFGAGDFRNMVFYTEQCDRFVSDCERIIGSQVARLSERNMKASVFISISLSAAEILNGDH
ncbi:uncharacterized protein [Primulina huaijiensis]|uniref:uncharacterized protein n=1 Tax=Primulina huaijiensis TaxID=1492673 RepID=UPI003CC70711